MNPRRRIAVRADASSAIGTGHVFRCLAVCDELSRMGGEAVFYCRSEPGDLIDYLTQRGYTATSMGQLTDPMEDAVLTRSLLQEQGPFDWLLVDHYGLDAAWESVAKGIADRLAVVDDLADRAHDADLLIDYSHFNSEVGLYDDLLHARTRRLVGQDYVFLRREFLEVTEKPVVRAECKHVLVTLGGNDPLDITSLVIDAIDCPYYADLHFDITVGLSNPRRDAIGKRASGIANVDIHLQHSRISELMQRADLCIGAGGMTTWERCYMGLPSLVVVLAANQVALTESLAHRDILRSLGDGRQLTVARLRDELSRALSDYSWRQTSAAQGMKLVDGNGVQRVLSNLFDDYPVVADIAPARIP